MSGRMISARGWGRTKWGVIVYGYRISVWEYKEILEMDGGDVEEYKCS